MGDDFMKKRNTSMTYGLRKIAFLLCAVFILGVPYFSIGHAEDSAGYFDESGNWAAEEAASSEAVVIGDPAEESAQPVPEEPLTGTYTMQKALLRRVFTSRRRFWIRQKPLPLPAAILIPIIL